MAARPKTLPSALVLFVRHGRTPTTGKVLPGRARGLRLAPEGLAQADAAGERLAALARIDAVYASPLERTRETAGAIAKRLGLPVRTDKGLLECDFGEWTGAELKVLSRRPEWQIVQHHPSGFRFPGGESFVEMQTRVVTTARRLADGHPGGVIVLVSHADPIKAAVADAAGTHLDLFQRLVISPCSVTAISYATTGPVVLTVNSVGALTELRAS